MLKVVIVEDEDIIRKGLVCTVDWQSMGACVVGEASDGEQGLQVVREQQPDVVLTDIRMPRISGLAMAEALQQSGSRAAIVFLTSYADFAYAQEALRLGAADYLLKPVEEEELRAVLQKLARTEGEKGQPETSNLPELVDWLGLLQQDGLNPYVRDGLGLIAAHYRERLSVEQTADALGISASYLSRKLKENTGHTFNSLVTRYRLQQSLALLREGRLRVYEVAEQVGFSDYKNFAQVFRKYLAMTPSQFMQGL